MVGPEASRPSGSAKMQAPHFEAALINVLWSHLDLHQWLCVNIVSNSHLRRYAATEDKLCCLRLIYPEKAPRKVVSFVP